MHIHVQHIFGRCLDCSDGTGREKCGSGRVKPAGIAGPGLYPFHHYWIVGFIKKRYRPNVGFHFLLRDDFWWCNVLQPQYGREGLPVPVRVADVVDGGGGGAVLEPAIHRPGAIGPQEPALGVRAAFHS